MRVIGYRLENGCLTMSETGQQTTEWTHPETGAKYTVGVDWAEGHCLACGQLLPLKGGRPRGRLAHDSPDTVAAILELNKAGLSLRDIGARMRMSKNWVRRILNRYKEGA